MEGRGFREEWLPWAAAAAITGREVLGGGAPLMAWSMGEAAIAGVGGLPGP